MKFDVLEEAAKWIDDNPEDSVGFYKWVNTLDDEQKRILFDSTKELPRVAPVEGPQTMAFNSNADILGYGGAAGGGKAQPIDAQVQTPYGPRAIGTLQSGDEICSPFDGEIQSVLSFQDFANWPMMRVHFDDGTSIDCSPEHEWMGAWEAEQLSLDSISAMRGGAVKSLETHQIKQGIDEGLLGDFFIPITDPCGGNASANYDISPEVIAAWICYGVSPVSDRESARIVIPQERADIAEGIRERDGANFPILHEKERLVVILPNDVYDRVQFFSYPFFSEKAKFPVCRVSEASMNAETEWRKSLTMNILSMLGRQVEEFPESFDYDEWEIGAPFEEQIDDAVQLARSIGGWARKVGKYEAAIRLRHDSPSSKRLLKKVDLVEDTGENIAMRCISVSDPAGVYLTQDYTITHNSALIAMLAYLKHRKAVVFRNDAKQLTNLIDDLVTFARGDETGLNRQAHRFRFHGKTDHFVEWGGIPDMSSVVKWRGREHDLFAVDEATEVPFPVVERLMTWMRTSTPGQRCRAIFTFNPPGAVDESTGIIPQGRWVIEFFAPWIDKNHPNPAKPGELRWFYRDEDGEYKETPNNLPVKIMVGGEEVIATPLSRTFIPARFTDNPFLGPEYAATLAALPEPDRTMMMLGQFSADIADSPNRCFPTAWVEAAMERWTPDGNKGVPMTAMGCDVSRGGADRTSISRRHRLWFDKPLRPPKKPNEIFDGDAISRHCYGALRRIDVETWINIDEIGIGASPFDSLKRHYQFVNGVNTSRIKTPSLPGRLKPYNMRSYLHLLLRILLDPKYGFNIALPPDRTLKTDLLSVYFYPPENHGGKVLVESKDDIRQRLRRSTDDLDALLLSLYTFPREPEAERLRAIGNPAFVEEQMRSGEIDVDDFISRNPRRKRNLGGGPNGWMAA